jgi:hypothetical protein
METACSEARVEAAACYEVRDEVAACSVARIKDGKWRQCRWQEGGCMTVSRATEERERVRC